MSVRVLAWAFDHSTVTHRGDLLVLLVLADHAHDDGTSAYPAVETIARKARLTRRGAQLALRRLVKAGAIEPAGKGPRGTISYRVLMEDGGEVSSPRSDFTGEVSDPGGRSESHEGAKGSSPEPSLEPSFRTVQGSARTREPIFELRDIKLPGGDMARWDGTEYVLKRVMAAAGGWARDHVPELDAEDAVKTMRALHEHRASVTPANVREAVSYYAAGRAERDREKAKRSQAATELLDRDDGLDALQVLGVVGQLQRTRPWASVDWLTERARELIPPTEAAAVAA